MDNPNNPNESNKKKFNHKNIIINLSLLLFVLLISFLFIEMGLRVTGICKISPEKEGNLFQFYQKVNNSNLQFDMKPRVEGYLAGKYVKINSQGFRDNEFSLKKGKDTYRIAILGDSVTFGWGVDSNQSYPKIVEKRLNEKLNKTVEVMNFGVPAYHGQQELETLNEKVLKYDPDLIIIGHFLGTPDEIWNLFDTSIKLPPKIKIILNENLCSYNWAKEKYSQILSKSNKIKKAPYVELYKENSTYWNNYKNIISNYSYISKKNNISIIIVLLPNWENLNENYEFKKEHALLNKTITESGLYSLDTYPLLKGINAEEYRIEHVHPNEKGHEKISEIIIKFINQNKFIK